MANGLNRVQIIGNLGRDPEVRDTQAGNTVCSFSIAANEKWKDRQTDEWKKRTEWFRVNTRGAQAHNCAQYLQKGSRVYIEGSLQTRTWTDKEGVERQITEVRAQRVIFLSERSGSGSDTKKTSSVDDDMPF